MDHVDEAYRTGEGVRLWPENELIRFLASHYPSNTVAYTGEALDIGCGSGRNMWPIAEKGLRVHGIDQSNEAILCCERYLDDRLSNRTYWGVQLGKAESIPWEDQSMDLVIDCQTIQHLSRVDHSRAYDEVVRVLKPGGLFWTMHWAAGDGGKLYDGKYPELQNWALRDLLFYIAKAGMKSVTVDNLTRNPLHIVDQHASWYCMAWVKL